MTGYLELDELSGEVVNLMNAAIFSFPDESLIFY